MYGFKTLHAVLSMPLEPSSSKGTEKEAIAT